MDGRGGCCIERYAGGVYDMSKLGRIMLRFRPIAPKPATGPVSNGPSPDQTEISPRSGRAKRRYSSNTNKSKKSCDGSGRKRKSSSLSQEKMDVVVTLPLLPETPERKDSPARVSSVEVLSAMKAHAPVWLSFDKSMENNDQKVVLDPTTSEMMPQAVRVVGSCVTVECVTDTWVDGSGMGSTDEERVNNLWKDTCPGFISDGMSRVTWMNEAFKKMVGQGNELGPGDMLLVLKEKASALMMMTWKAFTCRLRLQYSGGMEKMSSLTLPCDVWRMDGGGFAWRLDVKAALCLGR